MRTEIVWVFGAAAAGKETFILHLLTVRPGLLLDRLEWGGRELLACRESIAWVAQYSGDPLGKKRGDLPEALCLLAVGNPGAVILLKGQDTDLRQRRLERSKELLPDAIHRIIFIDGDIKEQYGRWKKKKWFVDSYTGDTVRSQVSSQVEMLLEIQSEFPIRSISGDAGSNYSSSTFPPSFWFND